MKITVKNMAAADKFLFLICAFLIFVSAGFAQTGEVSDISKQAAQVTEFDVNGMKVLIKRRAASPTVSAGLFIKGGAGNITDKNAGIENLMLNAATDAGKKYSREVVRREISGTGSYLSAGSNNDFSAVSLVVTKQNFDKVWDIFTDVTLNPAFAPEDVERERRQILTGLRESESDPDNALQTLENRIIYANHPYANNVTGTAQTISQISVADLKNYHQNLMQTSKLLLVIVGDLDAAELKPRIEAAFGKLPRGDFQAKNYPALDFSAPTVDITARNIPTNYVRGVFNAPNLNSPDYPAMRVATTILQKLVFDEVRTNRQLSYAPNAELDNFSSNTASIYVTSTDANQSVKVMLEQINLLKNNLARDEFIKEFSGSFLTFYYIDQETNAAQVAELARYELIGGGWRNAFLFLNKINDVKAKDIQAVAQKYMKNIRFVVVGNPASIDKKIFSQN